MNWSRNGAANRHRRHYRVDFGGIALLAVYRNPDYWVPLLPVRILTAATGAWRRCDGESEPVHAAGRILESGNELSLFEEEVPREGLRVTRTYQFTRWIDGSSHCWIGRRKGAGRGEGSSGLQFDALLDGE